MDCGWVLRHVAIALALTLAAGTSSAAKKPQGDKKAAKAHFQEGQTHFKLGRFDEALGAFSAAYEAAPFPAFLFNIGQCHRQLKNWERAQFFFEGYLREIPDAPNREVVEELITEAKAEQGKVAEAARLEKERQIEAERLAREQAERQQQAEAERLAQERADRERRAEEERQAKLNAAVNNPPPPAEEPLYTQWWLWTAVGVVVAGGATVAIVLATQPDDTPTAPVASLGVLDRRTP